MGSMVPCQACKRWGPLHPGSVGYETSLTISPRVLFLLYNFFTYFFPIFRTFLQVYYQVCHSLVSLPSVLFTS